MFASDGGDGSQCVLMEYICMRVIYKLEGAHYEMMEISGRKMGASVVEMSGYSGTYSLPWRWEFFSFFE